MKCKRLLCFGMAAALAFSSLPGITASAQEIQMQEATAKGGKVDYLDSTGGEVHVEEETIYGFKYRELVDGTISIEGCTTKLPSMVIPSMIDGKKVNQIRSDCFVSDNLLKKVEISDGMTHIGTGAFELCENLESITIPGSVTSMDPAVFYGDSKLKDIYYGGSQKQWEHIFDDYLMEHPNASAYDVNKYLSIGESVTVHFDPNAKDPEDPNQKPGQTEDDNSNKQPETPQKSNQTITVKNSITKTYGDKPFSLKAKAKTTLTYTSKDTKVAKVDKNGKVTIKGCGITNITITAKATGEYNKATKTVKLTVKPKKATLSSVKSTKKQTATVKWKKDATASGYIIQLATDAKFKKNKVQVIVSKNKTVSTTVKKLKAGKKYYVRVCAYAKSGKTKVQGDWSKVKTVKVKK